MQTETHISKYFYHIVDMAKKNTADIAQT